jgi:hypothetical protein
MQRKACLRLYPRVLTNGNGHGHGQGNGGGNPSNGGGSNPGGLGILLETAPPNAFIILETGPSFLLLES